MAVYILGAGASCCTDAYRKFNLQQGFIPDFAPPVMARFFEVARARNRSSVPLSELDPVLKAVGLTIHALERGQAGCANIETVLSLCDLLERVIAHWAFGNAKTSDLPQEVIELCENMRGWPIFGGSPEGTLLRAADSLKKMSATSQSQESLPGMDGQWVGPYIKAHWPMKEVLKAISEVYAPFSPYADPGKAGSPPACSNYSAFFNNRLRANDTVITFNYDFLLDRVLEEVAELRADPVVGPLPTVFTVGNGQGAFLKLHGSVLWYVQRNADQEWPYYCDDPDAGTTGHVTFCEGRSQLHGGEFPWLPPESPSDADLKNYDYRRVEPLIVPPTVAKDKKLLRTDIRKFWRQAEHALADAERICVVGYSFPPSDTHVTDMTREAGKRRSPHADYRDAHLTLVTKAKAGADEVQKLERRAKEAFPGVERIIAERDHRGQTMGFAEWVHTLTPRQRRKGPTPQS